MYKNLNGAATSNKKKPSPQPPIKEIKPNHNQIQLIQLKKTIYIYI